MSVKNCKSCGIKFEGIGQRRFCTKECRNARYATPIRQLRPGEPLPSGQPSRYLSGHGYVRLRWRVGTSYVETYEHRVEGEYVTRSEHVHHVNRNRADNSRGNLEYLTERQHKLAHRPRWWDAARMQYEQGDSMAAVARAVGVDPSTVFRALKRMGVATRSEKRIATPKRELTI